MTLHAFGVGRGVARRVMMAVSLLIGVVCLVGSAASAAVPSTLNDFFLPGSQPGQSGQIFTPGDCGCHTYDQPSYEPFFTWQGSMMAQAARDPLFYACLAIANQDAPQSGDLCLRCHTPPGWLGGRSVPTNGSALEVDDREGVQCHFCHKLVKPTPLGVNPYPGNAAYTSGTYPRDQTYLGTLSLIPAHSANGMYIDDSVEDRRGPFTDGPTDHPFLYSPFHHIDAALCGTCHDVSNPVYTDDGTGKYQPNNWDEQAPDFDPYTMFPIERTYSEWLKSTYAATGVYAPQFGGNKDTVSTCQDCHMRDVTGRGCDDTNRPIRSDLPMHDLTGANTFIPTIIDSFFPGETNPVALDSGVARATRMLQLAATLTLTVTPGAGEYVADVRVTNETGHKLPSGYPEGRRIWLHVLATDSNGVTVYESGAYNAATGVLTHDADVKIYEVEPGISQTLAPVVGLPAGVSFHFVLNDSIYKDNRIPPRGFTNAAYDSIQSPPVGYTYADGQYWDDTQYSLPTTARNVTVTLYYQTTTKEYVEFLRDENVTDNWGDSLYNLWNNNGKSAPVAMATETYEITAPVDSDGDGIADIDDNCPEDYNPDQTDDDSDGYGAACDCNDLDSLLNPETVWYVDGDNDGYGDDGTTLTQCEQPPGYVLDSTDCNDADSTLNPETVWYADGDNDGYGDQGTTLTQCEQPPGYVLDSTDCNDADSLINPTTVWYEDPDADGYGNPLVSLIQCMQPTGYVLDGTDNCPFVFNPDQADSNDDGIGDACDGDCTCPYQSDFDADGFITALDLGFEIDALFSGGLDPIDPNCPRSRGDFDNDGFNTALDLGKLIDHLFSGDDPPCDPCNPVQGSCVP